MKTKTRVLFSLLILLLCCGCKENKSSPLRVCVDFGYAIPNLLSEAEVERLLETFQDYGQAYGGPVDYELEIVPASGPERDTALDRLRTEIMAGGGPDVFYVANLSQENTGTDGLFPIPEKSMAEGIFLPLDEYIENSSQFTDWDNQIEPIMAAGRTEEGQVVVPLSYTLPVTFYRRSDVPNTYTADTTWADMLADESGILQAAGTWYHPAATFYEDFVGGKGDFLENILGKLADYEKEELQFTPEDLLERAEEILALKEKEAAGELTAVPKHFQLSLSLNYDGSPQYHEWTPIPRYEDLTMVPIYSDDGGATATIVSFAAVNTNTARPADAFFVIDILLSDTIQRSSNVSYKLLLLKALPVQADLGKEWDRDYRIRGWGFSEANFEEYCRVREQITNVQFQSLLTQELDDFYGKLQMAETNGQDPAQLAAEAYAAMERALKE